MTNRERILAILDGRLPDRIPWIPRLQIWYDANRLTGTLPDEFRDLSLREVERRVFGGAAARDGIIYRIEVEEGVLKLIGQATTMSRGRNAGT